MQISRNRLKSHQKVDETNGMIKSLDLKIDNCFSLMDDLTTKCKSLEMENNKLKDDINRLEQYSNLNCVEVLRLPEIKMKMFIPRLSASPNCLMYL